MILRTGTEAGQTEAIVDCNLADTKCLRWFESNPAHYCKQILMGRYRSGLTGGSVKALTSSSLVRIQPCPVSLAKL